MTRPVPAAGGMGTTLPLLPVTTRRPVGGPAPGLDVRAGGVGYPA